LLRSRDNHLDDNELDALVLGAAIRGLAPTEFPGPTLQGIKDHVDACESCREKFEMHKQLQIGIAQLRQRQPGPRHAECPDLDWTDLVAGLVPNAKAAQLVAHASRCDHCGPLLREAAEMLDDDASPEEEVALSTLKSAQPDWQRALARNLELNARRTDAVPGDTRKIRWLIAWRRPALALAAVALLAAVVFLVVKQFRGPSAEQLLADAYTEHRTLEIRLQGARYAPIRTERSPTGSTLDKPTSLLRAEALIAENLKKHPDDPTWLEARARADMLDGNYDSAIESLQRALVTKPDSPQLLTDLGSAYFSRGKSTDRPIDYGNAMESFSKAIAKSQDDPIALFNRALTSEQIFLYSQAVDDWEHYLRVEPGGEWSVEARERLVAVKKKLQDRGSSLAEPLLTPHEISAAALNNLAINKSIDSRIEEYQSIVLTEWLPKAVAVSDPEHSREAKFAVASIATISSERHGDFLLADITANSAGAKFAAAVMALSESISANQHGDYLRGRNAARTAAQLFHSDENRAGELRANAEEVYSDHLLWDGKRCMALIHILDRSLRRSRYSWLRAQMGLEESNCASLVGDLGTYRNSIDAALKQAESYGYNGLCLRALGFKALAAVSLGKTSSSFYLASKGLELFWTGNLDVMKGYNLYTDLDAAADGLRLPNFQVAIWREATALIDRHPNVLLRAMAHRWYGNAAYLASTPALAASEFSKASSLFAASPNTTATTRDRMDAEVWLARSEIRQGDVEQAAVRLESIEPTLNSAPSFDPEIGFYSAQADIGLYRDDSDAAEHALRAAIFLAEWALHSLSSERDRQQWTEQTRSAYRDLVAWRLRQGNNGSALELWEWYRGAELRATSSSPTSSPENLRISDPPDPRQAPPLPSPTTVSNQLHFFQKETVITYATFEEGIAAWVYDDRGVYFRWIPMPLSDVQEIATRFHRLCSDPSSNLSAVRITARSLYDLLVAPLQEHLELGRTLLFEPDDALETIPFEALLDQRGRYLADNFAVVITPGIYRVMHLRNPRSAINRETPALIVSVPLVAGGGRPALSDADSEAQSVSAKFSSARLLRGSGATMVSIRRQMRSAVVFHFAGHAISSPAHSGLMLAEIDSSTEEPRLIDGDSFAAKDVGRLQLAVLSACRTASQNERDATGAESLAHALLRDQVPHVIAGRWNIDSSETANFMKRFYTQLLNGNDVASSLHSAQLALASQPKTSHPYYWSAFELQGIR
jgi:CHAT domain-containing protein/tetratricopeptide (TPR) repeat protein